MPLVSIEAKAKEISSSLGEPSWLLKKRLEAASVLAASGNREVEDFAVGKGERKLEVDAKGEGDVRVVSFADAMQDKEVEDALCIPFSGMEQEPYLLSLALFTQGKVVKMTGEKSSVKLSISSSPGYFALFYLFSQDCTASIFSKTSISDDSHECRGLFLGKGATVHSCFVQSDGKEVKCTSGMVAHLGDGSSLKLLNSNLGAKEKQDGFAFLQTGRGSRCEHYEASLAKENQRFIKESEHMHLAPDTFSRSIFKYATADNSQVHVNGKVTIEQSAPGSDTHLLARSLLLSESAISKVVPMLFVRNSEVAAGHGSAMTPFSDEELFYLRSRGIGENESKLLILQGFLRDLLIKSEMEETLLQELQSELDSDAKALFPKD